MPSSQPRTPSKRRREEQHLELPDFQDAKEELQEAPLASLDTFIIPARDERGGSNHINLYVPPYLLRQMQIIVKSNRFPYLELNDLTRHALHAHIRWLTTIRHTLPSHINQTLSTLAEVARDFEYNTRSREVLDDLDRMINRYLEEGEIDEAIRLLSISSSKVEGAMASPKQQKFRAEILRRFGYVLEGSHVSKGNKQKQQLSIKSGDSDSDD